MTTNFANRLLIVMIITQASIAFAEPIDFNRDVRPILSDKCFACHGPDARSQKGDVTLHTREGATAATDKTSTADFVIAPGKPEDSAAYQRMISEEPDEQMPPPEAKNPITKREIAILEQWIKEGAEYKRHWAFIPVAESAIPAPGEGTWASNEIDHFVLERLESKGLKPSAEASRETLLRRVSFDLTGLPPTLAEIDAFLADSSPAAFENVVDRLLASERYGERMATDWMDLSRYADTYGYQTDQSRDMTPWRDWVIKAFNENLGYGDFVTWQLAGDMLPDATRDQRIATGFNRHHRQTAEGGTIEEEFRIEYVADRVETFGAAMLGLTVGCARCHDHKYDPISQANFYQLSAFFNSIEESGIYSHSPAMAPTPTLRLTNEAQDKQLAAAEAKILEAEQRLLAIRGEQEAAFAEWLAGKDKEKHGQAAWEAEQRRAESQPTQWTLLTDETATSKFAQTMTRQDGGSWLTGGAIPKNDVYTMTGTHPGGTITALRLDALAHATMTGGRYSRGGNGNFVLTGVELHVVSADGEKSAEFASVETDYQQKNWEIAKALDGNKATGWAVDGNVRKAPNGGVFLLKVPLDVPAGSTIRIRVKNECTIVNHSIGHLRVRVTDDLKPALPKVGSLGEILAKSPSELTPADTLFLQSAYEQLLIPDHQAYFSFDSRALINSVVGAGNGSGSTTEVAGKVDGAVQVNGDDPMNFGGFGAISRNDTLSFAMWLKTPKSMERAVILHRSLGWTDAGSRGYELLIKDGRLGFSMSHFWPGNAIQVRMRQPMPVDEWQHVAITYDGSSRANGLVLYLNGQKADYEETKDNLYKNITGPKTLTIGARGRDRGFTTGEIDDFRIFLRTLSAIEVQQIYGDGGLDKALGAGARRSADQRQELLDYYLLAHDEKYRAQIAALRATRLHRSRVMDGFREVMVMEESPKPRPAHLLNRGAYDQRLEQVYRATPASILAWDDKWPKNRVGLAAWLLDPRNPLPSRVAVNRLWLMCFGDGIVSTANDFGSQGSLPTHPELLDWLAKRFMDTNWDMKAMLKTIVMSSTYRQTSLASPGLLEDDPHNELLARGPKHRLTAEMIRDNALAVSGLMHGVVGGGTAKPYQPAGLWNDAAGKNYPQDRGVGLYRRSLYTYWKRTSPPPSMVTFDASRRSVCVVKRQMTSTPMQALVLLNDPQYVEAARKLAERMLKEGGTEVGDQIQFAFRLLTSRSATAQELGLLESFYAEQLAHYGADTTAAEALLKVGASVADQTQSKPELAARAVIASLLLNYDECVVKR